MPMPQAKQSFVFDHARTVLMQFAKKQGCTEIPTEKEGDARHFEATEFLSKQSDWNVGFLHINPEPWQKLVQNLKGSFIVVRFSREGFLPTPPQGANALFLHCIKKIPEITEKDIASLLSVLSEKNADKSLRAGIPASIQHLIAYEEPHRLRALQILLQGVLAYWAANPKHPKRVDAAKLLGVTSALPLSVQTIAQRQTFRRVLGVPVEEALIDCAKENLKKQIASEIGEENQAEYASIYRLVDEICVNGNGEMAADAVVSAFETIDHFLRK